MYCQSCGTLLPANTKVCFKCGRPASSSKSASSEPAVLADSNSTDTPIVSLVGSPNPQSVPLPLPFNHYNTQEAGPPLPYRPSLTPAGPPAQKPPRRFSTALAILIAVIVLLLAGAGLLIYYTGFYQPNLSHIQSTATAVTQITRTAQAIAAVENPYTHTGKLVITDPLRINSKSQNWDVNSNCAFIRGTYHAIAPNPRFSDYCIANGTNFSNFAIELTMKIVRGDAGGILFRVEDTSPNQYYDFYVGQDGTYGLEIVNGLQTTSLKQSTSAAINQGLNQENLIGVVARGNTIMLYVNHQPLGILTDQSYNHGQIGVYAVVYSHPTEVVFSNARLWKL